MLCKYGFFLLLSLSIVKAAAGQSSNIEEVISEAVEDIRAARADEAIDPLEDLFETDPSVFSSEHLSAAYWLGLAYLLERYPDDAREVWNIGLRALEKAGLFDPQLVVSFVRNVFEQSWKDDYSYAAGQYLRLLDRLELLPTETRHQFQPYLEALHFIVPLALRKKLELVKERPHDAVDSLGNELLVWWRSQDPAPVTRNNELLEEHLARISFAEKHYWQNDTFDDRGQIYIRFGPPSRQTEIRFDGTRFRNKVIDRSLTLNVFDFPKNEVWFYDGLGDPAQYIFHNTAGVYRIGETRHLLPAQLRAGFGSTDRGKDKSRAALRTLEEIYRQLSLHHQSYSNRYTDVAAFVSLLDDSEEVANANSAFDNTDQTFDVEASVSVRGGSFSVERPDLYLQYALSEAKAGDEMIAVDREEYVPVFITNTFDNTALLPLHVRFARFLNTDGSTRTEVYWAAPAGALAPGKNGLKTIEDDGYDPKDYMLVVSSVQKDAAFRERIVNHKRLTLPDVFLGEDSSIPTQTVAAERDTGLYHIAIQWDQYAAFLGNNNEVIELGPRIKAFVFRLDSLRALNDDLSTLEMSDLRPLRLPENARQDEVPPNMEQALITPSPYTDVDTPLGLYFELYHLVYGADDRVHYTVAYEVARTKGGLSHRNRGERTTFEAAFEHQNRSVQETLLLDLSEWRGKGTLEITVHVTDEVSGQTVNRTIEYEID